MRLKHNVLWILFLLSQVFSFGQDTHYSTNQFGSKSSLLSGAVIGGTSENDMVVYNPAALAFITKSGLSLNANAYRVENIRIKNDFGKEKAFKNSSFATVPILVGGIIKLNDPDWKLGYGLYSPIDFKFNAFSRKDEIFDAVDNNLSPGEELFIGDISKVSSLIEFSFTFGVSRRLSENWSLGLSSIFTYRSLDYYENNITHIQFNDDAATTMSNTIFMDADYFHIRSQLKFGANYRNGPWSFGATLTSPGLRLMGNGGVAGDVVAYNLPVNGELRTFFASDRQEKLKSTFKAPMSIGFGLNYSFTKSVLYFSSTYHLSVDQYQILTPEDSDFFRSSDVQTLFGSADFLRITGGAESVVNVALGYEYFLKPDLTLYAGLSSNNSFLPETDNQKSLRIDTEISSWDIYQLTLGSSKSFNSSNITFGLLLGVGGNEDHAIKDIFDGPAADGSAFNNRISAARYTSLGLMLGYRFNFGNRL